MPPHAPAGRIGAWALPARHLPPAELRELPEPPVRLWRLVGPGVVMAGVGLSSGEFILWPYIASQAGLSFLWAAALGVLTQFFLNMEIERYTLATGETWVRMDTTIANTGAQPLGIYFGTTCGEVWASTNEGAAWTCIARHLPEIYAVEAAERVL